ncbi:alpha/beta hydrolase family esterase [Actinopolymorpha alba]|uniref:alpha/beta hydrolase family esterase n=1 Tax=Actinopolymorpha alba TaxID=533267 RepID=UPI0003748701|nr:PHB depolymerase family esterase [Actinopolymorpha alba]
MPQRGRVLTPAVLVTVLLSLTVLAGCASWTGGLVGPASPSPGVPAGDQTDPGHQTGAQGRTGANRVGLPSPGPTTGSTPRSRTDPGTDPAGTTPPTGPSALPTSSLPTPGVVRLASGRVYVLPAQQDTAVRRSGTGRPLLVVLHSFGGTWTRLEKAAGFQARARGQGFVVAYGIGPNRSWNAGGCCGWAQSHEMDDVGYLADLVADVQQRVPDIDPRRIYLTGFSNGAMMTLRALCERPDLFAAGFGVAGQLVTQCAGGAPIHYLQVHGLVDEVVPYQGGKVAWLGMSFSPVPDLPGRVIARAPGSVVEIVTHRCGHVWPNQRQCGIDAAGVGLAFLSRYALGSVSG